MNKVFRKYGPAFLLLFIAALIFFGNYVVYERHLLSGPQLAQIIRGWVLGASTGNISITSPGANSTISGVVTFAVDTTGVPETASVKYFMGINPIGTSTNSPYSFAYNTGLVYDGSTEITAKALDASGNVLAEAMTSFTVNNHDNYVNINSPDLSQPVSGVVRIGFTAFDKQYVPAFMFLNIDGQDAGYWDTGDTYNDPTTSPINPITATISFDSRKFPNGKHELFMTMHSYKDVATRAGKDYRAMYLRTITINNPVAPIELYPSLLHVYLQSGQQTTVGCVQRLSDNTIQNCGGAGFVSDNPSVASVSSGGVIVAGGGEGFAKITITSGSLTTYSYVWVKNNLNVPHFSGSGKILSQYTPGQSLFVVAPFILEPSEVRNSTSGLLNEIRRAGVNTLQQGFYPNPRNLTKTWESWKSEYDSQFVPNWTYTATNGLHLLPSGDDVARNIGGEGWWTLNWPYGKQAVQYAMQKVAESGVAIGIDIVDEVSMMWGGTPKPPGKVGAAGSFTSISCSGMACTVTWPSNPVNQSRFFAGIDFALTGSTNENLNTPAGKMFTATNITSSSFDFVPAGSVTGTFTASNDPDLEFLTWAGSAGNCPSAPCNPPVPNNAITMISEWLRTAPATVPISWPSLGVSPPIVHANWMGKGGVSDYASHYWDTFKGRKTYPWGWGTEEANTWMKTAFYARQGYMELDLPQLILTSLMGPMYKKGTAGSYFNPPGDLLLSPGTTPQALVSNMFTAAAMGNSGVRLYAYDRTLGKIERGQAPLGSDLQTGANPFDTNVEHWRAMGYAANPLTKTLQPFILGRALSSPGLGKNVVTGARQASDGSKLLMVVNGYDGNTNLTVNFSGYRTGNPITKYLISSIGIKTFLIDDVASDVLPLKAGEVAVYLFPSSAGIKYTQNIVFAPTLPEGATKAYVHYSYIFSQDLSKQTDGVDCTGNCSLALDTSLGDVYYQYYFTDSNGSFLSKGSMSVIPQGSTGTTDTAPPTTPQNLSATTISTTQIDLSWTSSSDDIAVTGYKIYRDNNQIAIVTSPSYQDKNLSPNTTYIYRVSAYDAAGNISPQSVSSSATTLSATDNTPPSLSLISANSISESSATIIWGTDEPATSFVDYGLDTNYSNMADDLSLVTSHNLVLSNLSSGTTYYFRVRSTDAAGNESQSANQTFTTSNIPPPPPSTDTPPAPITTLTTAQSGSTYLTLRWKAPGDDGSVGTAASYDIRYSTSQINDSNWPSATQVTGEPAPKLSGTTQSYKVTNLSTNTKYYFAIKTTDTSGKISDLSNVIVGATKRK